MDKILIIDDDIDTCTLLKHFLTKNGYEVQTSVSGAAGIKKLHAEEYALILCDFRLGDMDAREVLQAAKLINSKTQIIVITGYSDVKIAVEVIKAGAFNYVTKPLLPDEILMNVKNAINKFHNVSSGIGVTSISGAETPVEKTILNNETGVAETKYIEGKSKESITVYKQLDIVGPTNYCVIIFGESGTGKEIAARRIHEKSKRANAPFIAVDCGALSKELAGSELFGHEKGAFTGALNSKMGSFELANGGTLLLDEVANLSYDVQIMLLRVVQERKMKRIGGVKDIDLDVRLIVASNENLMEAVNKG
ncbi:MAG: sigma 54-interacting transcriptional regulator, partial [Chitinophagales bacterium]